MKKNSHIPFCILSSLFSIIATFLLINIDEFYGLTRNPIFIFIVSFTIVGIFGYGLGAIADIERKKKKGDFIND